jgi:hypothetical protein
MLTAEQIVRKIQTAKEIERIAGQGDRREHVVIEGHRGPLSHAW